MPITPVVTPQVAVEQPKQSNFLIVLLSVLLTIAILSTGFFAYQTQKLVKELTLLRTQPLLVSTTEPTVEPVAIEGSEVDSTASWKTYTNKVFSFKYPVLWDTFMVGENTGSTLMVAPKEKVDKVKQIDGGFGGGTFLTLTINTKSEPPVWKTDEYWQVTSEPINVGGEVGTKYNINVIQDLPGLAKGDTTTSVVVKSGGTYVQIDLLDQTYKDEFNQILSTFKFIK